jgi:hypothetical protein
MCRLLPESLLGFHAEQHPICSDTATDWQEQGEGFFRAGAKRSQNDRKTVTYSAKLCVDKTSGSVQEQFGVSSLWTRNVHGGRWKGELGGVTGSYRD